MMIRRKRTDNYITVVMAKLNFFPKKQNTCIAYSNKTVKSELFRSLYVQISPRNSLASRLLKTKAILFLRSFFKTFVETPNDASHIGLIKANKSIFFEFNMHEPVSVWKKEGDRDWEKSKFLGYPLILEYTLFDFNKNKNTIYQALQLHWNAVKQNKSNIHGDLTHFNILHNEKGELFFIDKKDSNHSKLFDFFYFYAYYKQCICKCVTLNVSDRNLIISDLKKIIRTVCIYESEEELNTDFFNINIPSIHGLVDVESLKKDFIGIFNSTNRE